MIKVHHVAIAFSLCFLLASCSKNENDLQPVTQTHEVVNPAVRSYTGFPETFESGTKTSYTTANVTLTSGSWNFNNALIGTSSSDRKNGSKSVRIQNTGNLTMNFNVTGGASSVSVAYARYGSDASSTFGLWYSTNSGSTWTQTGSTITVSATTLNTASFSLSLTGNARFQLRKQIGRAHV